MNQHGKLSVAIMVSILTIGLQAGHAPAALVQVNGTTMVDYIVQMKSTVLASGSNDYDQPTAQQLIDFRALADALWITTNDAALNALVTPAASLGYDVVKLTDSGTVYYGLREQQAPTLGWGSYFVRQGERRDALIEAPHPLFDTNSPNIAAKAYVDSQARGFLMAGAHRNANGSGTADVAHLADSIFLQVHESWNGTNGENTAWQIHGFNLDTHPAFPADTDAVLSNGTGGISPEILALDAAIEALGPAWESYAYNTLNVNDPLNQTVNGNVDGQDFGGPDGLGATTNVEQLHSTGLGGRFVHIELEKSFRTDNSGAGIPFAAAAITTAITQTTPLVPEPATVSLLGASATLLIRRARR